jgi:hypothetical protein
MSHSYLITVRTFTKARHLGTCAMQQSTAERDAHVEGRPETNYFFADTLVLQA